MPRAQCERARKSCISARASRVLSVSTAIPLHSQQAGIDARPRTLKARAPSALPRPAEGGEMERSRRRATAIARMFGALSGGLVLAALCLCATFARADEPGFFRIGTAG